MVHSSVPAFVQDDFQVVVGPVLALVVASSLVHQVHDLQGEAYPQDLVVLVLALHLVEEVAYRQDHQAEVLVPVVPLEVQTNLDSFVPWVAAAFEEAVVRDSFVTFVLMGPD